MALSPRSEPAPSLETLPSVPTNPGSPAAAGGTLTGRSEAGRYLRHPLRRELLALRTAGEQRRLNVDRYRHPSWMMPLQARLVKRDPYAATGSS